MPTAITGLGQAGPGRPLPVVSPLIEFGSALHVLRDPDHHGATGWAAAVQAKMSRRLVAWTRAWWWAAQAIRAAPFVSAASPAGDFEGALGWLRAMPASRLAGQLLRPVSRSGDARDALHWSRSRESGVVAVVEALVSRPEEAAADFVGFLDRSWRAQAPAAADPPGAGRTFGAFGRGSAAAAGHRGSPGPPGGRAGDRHRTADRG